MPGFSFDVALSIFMEEDTLRERPCAAAENEIFFHRTSLLFLPTRVGFVVSDVDFLFIQVLIFQPDMDTTLFFSFVLLHLLDCGVSSCMDIEHVDSALIISAMNTALEAA